jgi:hypothetical protein
MPQPDFIGHGKPLRDPGFHGWLHARHARFLLPNANQRTTMAALSC